MDFAKKSLTVRLAVVSATLSIFAFGCNSSNESDDASAVSSVMADDATFKEGDKVSGGNSVNFIGVPSEGLPGEFDRISEEQSDISNSEMVSSNLWDSITCGQAEEYERTLAEGISARAQLYFFGGDINLTEGGKYGEWHMAETVDFHPVMVSEGVVPRDIFENTELYLELRDVDDNFLEKIPVEIVPPSGSEDPGAYTFLAEFLNLPWEDDISQNYHKISLVDNSDSESPRVIDSISRSNNMPIANIILPTAGQKITGETFSLVWSGNDMDGDELTYRTWYSIDNGSRYQMIDSWLNSTSRELNLHSFPRYESNEAKFAVSVSDGAQSVFVESSTFCVPKIIPQFLVLNVDDETEQSRSLYNDQTLILRVTGDSELAEEYETITFDWHSDRVGFLGKGISMLLSSAAIGVGNHTITATGKMSNDEEITVSVRINVFNF